jgi:hemoglobin
MKQTGLKLGTLALCLAAAACSPGQLNTPPTPISGGGGPLYERLGEEAGIRTVVNDFIGRVVKDPRINGYFLNAKVDPTQLSNCLTLQLGKATGGPQVYPSMGCRDMKTSHKGLKISSNDFADLAGQLVAALQAANVVKADIDTIVAKVGTYAPDIIEDQNSNATVYQRVGRKPAIIAVVNAFTTRVVGDARINGFFGRANADRLKTCLVRQVCSIDGPCKYGEEVDGEPGVGKAQPCQDMVKVHSGMTSPPGGGTGKPLVIADFTALVEDLIAELDAAKVQPSDKSMVLGALGALCKQIVAGNGAGCP